MSVYARLAIILILIGAVAALWWKADRMLAKADAQGYERRAQEDEAAADLQRETNRDRARHAEVAYTPQAEAREKFLVITATEVRHETDSLAACLVPEPARLRLNAAAECAEQDGPAACSPDDTVRRP